MLSIIFWTFSKNTNSTKRPSIQGTDFQCELLGETSFISPRIMLATEGNPTQWNYAYIPHFSRYYFVEDWTWNEGLWVASLKVDALASWENKIADEMEYVLRSSYADNPSIVDTLYPIEAGIRTEIKECISTWPISNLNDGYYIVGIINQDTNAIGAVSYYAFSKEQFKHFCKLLMGNTEWLNIPTEEISAQLTKALVNPFQYVVSCMWVPFKPKCKPEVKTLDYGWWSLPASCFPLSSNSFEYSAHIEIPKHPQVQLFGKYRNLAPYTSYVLDFMPFGQVELDTTKLVDANWLKCYYKIDCITGESLLQIIAMRKVASVPPVEDELDCVGFVSGQIGVPIQMAQMARDYLGMATNVVSSATTAIAGFKSGDIASGIQGIATGISSTINSAVPSMMTKGSNGSFTNFTYKARIIATFRYTSRDDNKNRGRPYCHPELIKNVPGYILVADANLTKVPATATEIDIIKKHMNSGFFYEPAGYVYEPPAQYPIEQ